MYCCYTMLEHQPRLKMLPPKHLCHILNGAIGKWTTAGSVPVVNWLHYLIHNFFGCKVIFGFLMGTFLLHHDF